MQGTIWVHVIGSNMYSSCKGQAKGTCPDTLEYSQMYPLLESCNDKYILLLSVITILQKSELQPREPGVYSYPNESEPLLEFTE